MANNDFVNDINDLQFDMEVEGVDWGEEYQDPASRPRMPQPGRYDLQMPTTFSYKKGGQGQLVVALDPLKIVGGDSAGFEIRFTQVSTKKFKNQNASQAADVLRNVGSLAQPVSPKEWADAFEGIAGEIAQNVDCVWGGWDKVAKTEIPQKAFPRDPETGLMIPFIEVEDPNAEGGKRRVWANLKVNVRGFAPQKN